MNRLLAVLLVVTGGVAAGCGDDARPPARATLGGFQVEVRTRVDIADGDGAPLLPGARNAIETRHADATYEMKFGAFKIEEPVADPWRSLAIEDAVVDGDMVRLTLAGGGSGEITAAGDGALLMTLHAPAGQNRMAFAYTCGSGEHFQGLGGQAFDADHAGEVVPLWVQEEGIGKVTTDDYEAGVWISQGRRHSTHTPIPIVVSSRGYALAWETDARSVVSLCAPAPARPGVVRVEVWEPTLKLRVFAGPTPKQAIERVTAWTGRPALPPAFTWAPWLDAMFGSANVRRVAAKLRAEGVPSSVIWTEDWAGALADPDQLFPTADATIDRELYPDIEQVAAELHAAGFKFLSYYNPQVHTDSDDYVTARDRGYLLKSADGEDALFFHVYGQAGQVDLTNPAAREWMKTRLTRSLALGFDGWMADFGEYTPFDTVASDGEPGATHHNRVPELWAGLQRELFAAARPDGDWLTFARSGFTGSRREVAVVWGGDPDTTFSQQDGLPAALYAGLSLGISGVPFYGHDIAGYFSLLTPNSDRELFLRWAAFGALSPIMRTHHGLEYRANWSFDRDPETLAAYRELARLHISLTPYLEALAEEAVQTGIPLMRHLYLEYPDDLVAWDVHDEYLLGPDLLVAPVMRRGATEREVYLPAGVWRDYFAPERVVTGGRRIQVEAPLGTIPAWVRDGATIPTIDPETETLVAAAD